MVDRMPQHLPIACSLNAADFTQREALMAQLGRDALITARHDATHAELRFAAGAGIRDRINTFVAGERTCCAFLTMNVAQHGDEVVLRIDAPIDAEPVLAELVAAFQPTSPTAS